MDIVAIKNLPFEEKIKLLDKTTKAYVWGYIEALLDCQRQEPGTDSPVQPPATGSKNFRQD
jgi:hypothetical protein